MQNQDRRGVHNESARMHTAAISGSSELKPRKRLVPLRVSIWASHGQSVVVRQKAERSASRLAGAASDQAAEPRAKGGRPSSAGAANHLDRLARNRLDLGDARVHSGQEREQGTNHEPHLRGHVHVVHVHAHVVVGVSWRWIVEMDHVATPQRQNVGCVAGEGVRGLGAISVASRWRLAQPLRREERRAFTGDRCAACFFGEGAPVSPCSSMAGIGNGGGGSSGRSTESVDEVEPKMLQCRRLGGTSAAERPARGCAGERKSSSGSGPSPLTTEAGSAFRYAASSPCIAAARSSRNAGSSIAPEKAGRAGCGDAQRGETAVRRVAHLLSESRVR